MNRSHGIRIQLCWVLLAVAVVLPGTGLDATAAEPWSLEQALEHALLNNPDARIAQQRIVAAQAGLDQANSAFLPRVQIQSSYSRTDNPMMVFGSILNQESYRPTLDFNDVPDVDNLNARASVSIPIYSGGRNVAGRRAAQAGREAARLDQAGIRNSLGFEVVRGFHTVLKTREFVAAASAAVNSLEANLQLAQSRMDAGTLLRSDLLDIEVRLAQAREDQVRARNAMTLAERAVRHLLGIEAGDFVLAATAPSVSVPTAQTGGALDRPEILAARSREKAAEAQLAAGRSGYRPRVNAFGSVDYDRGWVTHGDGRSYTVGVLAQWDLWDGFATRSKVREARAQVEVAREEQRKLRLALDYEAEQARLGLSAAAERLTLTRKMVEQAEESATLLRKRFEQGLALATQILDSEAALLAARVRRAEAEADQRIAVAALRKALALPQLDSTPVAP